MNKRGMGALCAFLITAAMTPALLAQAGVFGGGPMGGRAWGGMRGGFGFGPPVTGEPYTAVRTIAHVQTLANGTTISHTATVNEARDSEGRTYSATTEDRDGHTFVSYRVVDPVAGTVTSWTSNSKKAMVMNLPDRSQSSRWGRGQANAAGHPAFRRNGAKPTVQSLGSQTVNGVVADGTLTTFVIPAGREGNNEPLTITRQTWRSTDLQLVVQSVDTDPRSGTTTMNVSNIQRGEPQASLFQPPAGYSVQQVTRGRRFAGQ